MASSVYEEALADAKKLREVTEQNAKNAIIEAVAPKIRKYIEMQLIGESSESDELDKEKDDENILTDIVEDSVSESRHEDDEFVLTQESAALLSKVMSAEKDLSATSTLGSVKEQLEAISQKPPSAAKLEKLRQLTKVVEDAYDHLSDEKLLEANRKTIENDLNSIYETIAHIYNQSNVALAKVRVEKLGSFKKSAMELTEGSKLSGDAKKAFVKSCLTMLSEAGSVYRVIGSLGSFKKESAELKNEIKNISKEIWQMSKKQGKVINEADVMLRLNLPDDIELDPAMLNIDVLDAEGNPVGEDGEAPVGDELSLDGGGLGVEDEDAAGAGLDSDLDAEVPMGGEEVPDEEEVELEGSACEGCDELEEGLMGLKDDDVVEISESMLRAELKKMREGKADDAKVLDDFGDAKSLGDPWLDQSVTTEGEDLEETDEVSLGEADEVAEVKKEAVAYCKAAKKELAETKRVLDVTRKQLAEINLFNAKLLHANRVLQANGLTQRQKVRVIEALDKARTLREVKLLYKSLTESIGERDNGALKESATAKRVMGSASRPTKPAATNINESVETDRWATLAGLKD